MSQVMARRWAGGSRRRGLDRRRVAGVVTAIILALVFAGPLAAAERIVTIGDSWAWLVANGAPGSAINAPGYGNAMQQMLNVYHPGVTVANESFMGGTAAQHAAQLADITNRINSHPDADVVWLSSGGNDMLLGLAGGGFYVNNPNNPAVYAAIAQNVSTVVNHILSLRPDVQVVIEGYDYLNIWDTIPGSSGDPIRLNLGVVRASTGNSALDAILNIQQNQAVNDGFKQAEAGKSAIADASRRVHHISNWGLNNTLVGYSGMLGSVPGQGFYPPELWPQLPTPASLMGNTDPIHLNTNGYLNLVNRAESQFFQTAFQAANLSLNSSVLNFGNVLVGGTGQQTLTASNAGPNFTKVKNLTLPAAGGEFSGGAQSFNPLFQDPLLGSDTANKTYSYTPTNRGNDSLALSATSDSGNRGFTLQGRGVAPVNQVTSAPAAPTRVGTTGTGATVTVTNVGDGNLSGQGAVSNLQGSLGSLGGVFAGTGGGVDLGDGAATAFSYGFTPTARGLATASVTAAFNNGSTNGANAAQNVLVSLSGLGVGPEFTPTSSAVDFGAVALGDTVNMGWSVSNTSNDPNGGNLSLTNLTLLSASITGPDAAEFSLSGFVSGTVLGQGGAAGMGINFLSSGALGAKHATLELVTDRGAAFGATGQTFSIPLSGITASSVTEILAASSFDNRKAFEFSLAGAGTLKADSADGLLSPIGAAYDSSGNLFLADVLKSRVFKVDAAGTTTTFADLADGVVGPAGITFDAGGNLWVANYLGDSIARISPAGVGTIFADSLDGLVGPFDLAFDPTGRLFVADTDSHRVLIFDAAGNASTFADASDGLLTPIGLAVDDLGNVYVADVLKNSITKFTPGGVGTLFANLADGLGGPVGMTFDASGNLYVANYLSHKIIRLDPAGNASLFADATDGLQGPFDVALGRLGIAPAPSGFASVPEPSTAALALAAFVALTLLAIGRQRSQATSPASGGR